MQRLRGEGSCSYPGRSASLSVPKGRGGTEPAKVRVNMAEVSQGREPGRSPGERSEGSVIGRCP